MSAAEHKGLAEALLAFQEEAPTLKKAETAKIPTKSGKEFSYKYTDLAAMLGIVRPLLVKHQLQWSTFPTTLEGEPALRYKITHVPTGECEQDVMKLLLASRDAQAQGSGITYSRRYAMIAVLDLAAEDDDGKGASEAARKAQGAANGNSQPPPPRLLNPTERDRVLSAIADTDQNEALIFAAVGVSSPEELNVEHAKKIRALLDQATRAAA